MSPTIENRLNSVVLGIGIFDEAFVRLLRTRVLK